MFQPRNPKSKGVTIFPCPELKPGIILRKKARYKQLTKNDNSKLPK